LTPFTPFFSRLTHPNQASSGARGCPRSPPIANVRSSSTSTTALKQLRCDPGSKLIIIILSSTSGTGPALASSTLLSHLVSHLDTVIANSGAGAAFDLRDRFEANALGPIERFQAAYPLLRKSKALKFVLISSSLGSIGAMEGNIPSLAHGVSKAGANYMVGKLHYEHEDIKALAVHPG